MGVAFSSTLKKIPLGKAEVLSQGSDLLILALGASVHPALAAAARLAEQGFSATVVNARFVKPLDREPHPDPGGPTRPGAHGGGKRAGRRLRQRHPGIAGRPGASGDREAPGHPGYLRGAWRPGDLQQKYGLDADGILKEALAVLGQPAQPKKVVWGAFN